MASTSTLSSAHVGARKDAVVTYQSSSDDEDDDGVSDALYSDTAAAMNLRFQDAVFRTAEEQLEAARVKLEDRESELRAEKKARERVSIALGDMNQELRRVRDALEKATATNRKHEHEIKLLQAEKERERRDRTELQKRVAGHDSEVRHVREQLEARTEEATQERQLRLVMKHDLQMGTHVHDALRKQLDEAVAQQKAAQERADTYRTQAERAVVEKRSLEQELAAQRKTVELVRAEAAKAAAQAEDESSEKDAQRRKFEDALRGVSERDAVIHRLTAQCQEEKLAAREVAAAKDKTETENAALRKELAEVKDRHAQLVHQHNKATLHANKLQKERAALGDRAGVDAAAASEAERRAEAANRERKMLEERNRALSDMLSRTRGELEALRAARDDARVEQHTSRSALNEALEAAEKREKALVSRYEQELAQLRNEEQRTRLRADEMERVVGELADAKERADADTRKVVEFHGRVESEAASIKIELERRNYLVAKLEEELKQAKSHNVDRFETEITALREQLAHVQEENKKLTAEFFSSQVKQSRAQREAFAANREKEVHAAQAAQAEGLALYSHTQAAKIKRAQKAHAKEVDMVRLNARKAEKKATRLRERNIQLEKQLHDAFYLTQYHREEHEADKQVMLSEMRAVRDHQAGTGQLVEALVRDKAKLERKLSVVSAQLDAVRVQNEKNERQLFDMRQKLVAAQKDREDTHVQLEAWKRQLKKMFGHGHRDPSLKKLVESTARRVEGSRAARRAGAGGFTSPSASSPSASAYSLPGGDGGADMKKQALRMSTLASERLNELTRVQQQLRTFKKRCAKDEEALEDLEERCRDLTAEKQRLTDELDTLMQRATRAECLSASLERQLRAAGGSSIDYNVSLAALSAMSPALRSAIERDSMNDDDGDMLTDGDDRQRGSSSNNNSSSSSSDDDDGDGGGGGGRSERRREPAAPRRVFASQRATQSPRKKRAVVTATKTNK